MAHPLDPDQVSEERPAGKEDRSLGELFAELTRETTTLVRQEVDLAKTEMSHKAAEVGKDVGFLAAGGAAAYAGLLALIAALIIGLGQAGVTWWLSALVVGLIVAGIGGFLVWRGLNNLKHETKAPLETIETLKEDARWAKEQTK
jgi:uncharacterized protein HemX